MLTKSRKLLTPIASATVLLAVAVSPVRADSYTIPKDQIDKQKIFYGPSEVFSKPAEVDYCEVVKATPEYAEIKKNKIERGTGKYWILVEQASERAIRAIRTYGKETEYDLIAASGYLGGLKPPIPAKNVTKDIIELMLDDK